MIHKVTTFATEKVGTPVSDPATIETLKEQFGDFVEFHYYDIERNGQKLGIEVRYTIKDQYVWVPASRIFKAQHVQLTQHKLYFEDIHGNIEDIPYSALGCTFKQFMALDKYQKAAKIVSAYV